MDFRNPIGFCITTHSTKNLLKRSKAEWEEMNMLEGLQKVGLPVPKGYKSEKEEFLTRSREEWRKINS